MRRWGEMVLFCVVLLVAGRGAWGANNTVNVGIFVNDDSMIGIWQKMGYQLALSQLNNTSTANKPKPIYAESSDNLKVIMESMSMMNDKNVIAVVGGSSSKSSSYIAGVTQRIKTPFLIPSAPMELLSRFGFDYVFRLNAPIRWYINTLLNYAAIQKLRPKTIGFVWEDTPFGRRFTVFSEDKAKSLGFRVVANAKVDLADKGRKAADEVIKAEPDILMLVGNQEDSLRVLKWLHEANYKPRVLLGAGAGFSMPSFVKVQNGAAEGLVTVSQWHPTVKWSGVPEFISAFKERFKKEPNYLAAEAYATVQVLVEALKKAKCTGRIKQCREGLKKALTELKTDTVFGPVRFDSFNGYTNQNPHPLLLLQIEKGSLKIVAPPELATN